MIFIKDVKLDRCLKPLELDKKIGNKNNETKIKTDVHSRNKIYRHGTDLHMEMWVTNNLD